MSTLAALALSRHLPLTLVRDSPQAWPWVKRTMRFISEAGQGEGRLTGLQVERLTGRLLRRFPCQPVNLLTYQLSHSFDPCSTATEAVSNKSRTSVEEK